MSNQIMSMKYKLPVISILSYIAAGLFIAFGFYKMWVYNNGDNYPYEPINAYVGGDAYNYIINAGYSGAFFTLALIFVLIGSTFAVIKVVTWSTEYSKELQRLPEQFPDLPEL